jgi:hypothetical protein
MAVRILKNRDRDQQPKAHGRFSLPEKKKGGGAEAPPPEGKSEVRSLKSEV